MHRNGKHATPKRTLAARILAERRAVLGRLAAVERRTPMRSQAHVGGDNTPTSEVMEAAQEGVDREFDFVSRKILVARLMALARAEDKIRAGSYGRCDLCRKPIGAARLRALPEAVRCIACAAVRESDSAALPRIG